MPSKTRRSRNLIAGRAKRLLSRVSARLSWSLALPYIFVAALPLAGVAQSPRNANRSDLAAAAAIEQAIVEAIARAEPSVVAIARTSPPEAGIPLDAFGDLRSRRDAENPSVAVSAGVIIDRGGLVLTQYLAVREGDQHAITTIEGKTYQATIRAADPRSGLAVLAIQPSSGTGGPPLNSTSGTSSPPAKDNAAGASFPAIRFGDAEKLRKGQFVIAIGNPFAVETDGQPTASWGIVTNLARKAPADTNLNDAPGPSGDYRTTLHHLGTLIQTDAKLAWSAGGGALITLRGELIGITTTAATIAGHEQPAGYAIPINSAFRRIIDTLKEGREVEYGMLGISFGAGSIPSDSETRSRVTVGQVFAGGPAARAGLSEGDIVTRIDDLTINNVDKMQFAVSVRPPSTITTLEYERDGKIATTEVTLAKLAVAGKTIATVRPDAWRGIRVDYATALEAPALFEAIESRAYDPEGCVLVREVEADSMAWQAGVRAGMFISHVGNHRVTSPEEFQAATKLIGDKLDIRLTRQVEQEDDAQRNGDLDTSAE